MRYLLIGCLLLAGASIAISQQWEIMESMQEERYGLGAVSYDDDIWAIGGFYSMSMEKYDCFMDHWSTSISPIEIQYGICAARFGHLIYTFGTWSNSDLVLKYNFASSQWSFGSELPIGAIGATAQTIGTDIYVIGGSTELDVPLNTVQIFDTQTETWSSGTPCPATLPIATSALIDDNIYVFAEGANYRYDSSDDEWVEIAARPVDTWGSAAVAVNDNVYLLCGEAYSSASTHLQIYNTTNGSWTIQHYVLNYARSRLAAVYSYPHIYAIGGRNNSSDPVDYVERLSVYTPPRFLTLTIAGTSGVIPASGGTLTYNASLVNLTGMAQSGQAWTELVLPGGTIFGPLMVVPLIVQPGVTTFIGLSQNIPAFAPAGGYMFTGKIGYFGPNRVFTQDDLLFRKLAETSDGVDDWDAEPWTVEMESDQIHTSTAAPPNTSVSPNPFNTSTLLTVFLPSATQLNVAVFNVMGQQVDVIANGTYNAGTHNLVFEANGLASGVYFVRTQVPGHLNQLQKVLLVR